MHGPLNGKFPSGIPTKTVPILHLYHACNLVRLSRCSSLQTSPGVWSNIISCSIAYVYTHPDIDQTAYMEAWNKIP